MNKEQIKATCTNKYNLKSTTWGNMYEAPYKTLIANLGRTPAGIRWSTNIIRKF